LCSLEEMLSASSSGIDAEDFGVGISVMLIFLVIFSVVRIILNIVGLALKPKTAAMPYGYNPQMGYPQNAYPQQAGYPQAGYPQNGYPQAGYPQNGYAPNGVQQGIYPQNNVYPQQNNYMEQPVNTYAPPAANTVNTVQQSAPPAEYAAAWTCSNCGNANSAESKFCQNCGMQR
ncbi:MAG: hypothetical protein NC228_10550, partial [[Eubacterium] siraeum]|nr:hypothetical protein [[Eubacterium] siraeum]